MNKKTVIIVTKHDERLLEAIQQLHTNTSYKIERLPAPEIIDNTQYKTGKELRRERRKNQRKK